MIDQDTSRTATNDGSSPALASARSKPMTAPANALPTRSAKRR